MLSQITPIFELLGVHISLGSDLIIRVNLNLNLSNVFFFVIVLTTKVIATSTQLLVVSIFHDM